MQYLDNGKKIPCYSTLCIAGSFDDFFGLGGRKGGSPEKIPLLEGGHGKKSSYWGGVMQLSNDTSKNSTSPPYLVKNERSLRWHRAHTEDGGGDDHDISLDVPVEILSSTHFNLKNTHPEVDNKKVSKLLTTPAFNQKVKAIVLGEAHLIVDW